MRTEPVEAKAWRSWRIWAGGTEGWGAGSAARAERRQEERQQRADERRWRGFILSFRRKETKGERGEGVGDCEEVGRGVDCVLGTGD
jgi:hypothetical protein